MCDLSGARALSKTRTRRILPYSSAAKRGGRDFSPVVQLSLIDTLILPASDRTRPGPDKYETSTRRWMSADLQ